MHPHMMLPAIQGSQPFIANPENIGTILLAAKVLSGVSLIVFLGFILNIWLRASIPEVSYGSITLSPGRMRWLWTTFLLGSTLAAAATADAVVVGTRTFEDPDLEASLPAGTARVQNSIDAPTPFYRFSRHWTSVDGQLLEEEVREEVVIPWAMLSAFLAYVILVMRWNPENRWALRILRGKRWVKKNRR